MWPKMKWIVITASSERAPVVQGGWADGQRIVVVITQIPMAAASITITTMLYILLNGLRRGSSLKPWGLSIPMLSNRCAVYTV